MENSSVNPEKNICAIVLAAGLSTRMGQPKMLLSWGNRTIIENVLNTLSEVHIDEIMVVLGAEKERIQSLITKTKCKTVFNPNFSNGSMLDSLQTGVNSLEPQTTAFLIVLGDQPGIRSIVMNQLITIYLQNLGKIIIPSYQQRRGHPWIIDSRFKQDILALKEPSTLRDFLKFNKDSIVYFNIDEPCILEDMDTPEDYQRLINQKKQL